jgi:hypothetical protein
LRCLARFIRLNRDDSRIAMGAPITETIFVALLNEGTDAWRPVQAVRRAGGAFLIVSKNDDPELEEWQFPSGSLVRCVVRKLSGGDHLVALESVPAPRLTPIPT